MDVWEHDGRRFEVVMASDLIRDGMGLELTDLAAQGTAPLMEAFWHDDGSGFEFIVHAATELPFSVIERFVETARKQSPPAPPNRTDAVAFSNGCFFPPPAVLDQSASFGH